ncbi:MAG: hypothetical protein COB76_06335 [Alphaproteobacteria bacterium]|nr:MAG: hypothetical protein COB76_06335 [Alphaproteobacteria bacterium]
MRSCERCLCARRPILSASIKEFKSLLIVRGVDAPENAAGLMRMVMAEPEVAKYIKGAEWIGGRRWDLITISGARIHLPDDDMGFALSRLAKAIKEKNILEKPLKSLDLRAPDRIIIETQKGRARNLISAPPQKNAKTL